MPFWGDLRQFRRAVESVRAQTDGEWRLVVIDDRYPSDEQRRILDEFADPRIHYVLNEENLGVSGNFGRAVDLAESPYAVIMGCDDVLLPGYVTHARELASRYPDASYLQSGVEVIDDDDHLVVPLADRVKAWYRPRATPPLELRGEPLALSLLRGNWTYFPSLCWRTDVLRRHGFRPEFQVVLDLALQLEIAIEGGALLVDDTVTFRYRRHAASVSSATAITGGRFDEEKAFFRETAVRLADLGWTRAARTSRHHLSSRLNALSRLPSTLRPGSGMARATLLRHAFSAG